MEGWIKLHRRIEDWKRINDLPTLRLWIYILDHARHEDGNWNDVPLKAGQMVIGRKGFCRETGISEQTYRTSLRRLKDDGTITTKATNQYTIVTVENWDFYQSGEEKTTSESTSVLTSNQPATNQQLTTNKNVKNVKNERSSTTPKPPKGATTDVGATGGFKYEESLDALIEYAIYRNLRDTTTRTVSERVTDLLEHAPSYEAIYKALDSFDSNVSLYNFAHAYYTGDTSKLKEYELSTYNTINRRRYCY